ncbi:ribosomal protein S3 [Rhodothermus marinus SG0.5JP17-172]|jgi:small subunit ribosomal protein S3|uniref:30S ribosomal protein S3 n=1 Tax=Rhodothermus marinus TaxID=29549 RepID=UPI000223DB20|nr:30S ribosomal protein S3 [Rhodothermus marinus]AEN73937.1 ribosomal protein S3 [Rhodothermus marinus SG0.5JP17-172]
MGQKTHPIGFRLGVIRGWFSSWYAEKDLPEKLIEDEEIRRYLQARLKRAGLSRVVIERTPKRVILTLHTSRPGVVIGRGGQEVEKLREELQKLTGKEIQINISEIKRPELDASLVAQNIAQQLEGRVSFRRAMKQAITAAMRMGAQGIRIKVSGRLGGAEMSRTEQYLEGRVPLHTLRANIDYAQATAYTIYGTIGVKVWIFLGEIIGKPDLSPNALMQRQQQQTFEQPERRRRRRARRAGRRAAEEES